MQFRLTPGPVARGGSCSSFEYMYIGLLAYPALQFGWARLFQYTVFWQVLYNHNADLILAGHDHIYERFAPQTPSGTRDTTRGIREFIVGSGGANHTSLATIFANSEVHNVDTYGILKLTLHPTSYDWQFVPEAGKTFTDSGTTFCHGQTSDITPPTTPANLVANPVAPGQVNLIWTASTDNVGVVGYQVFRDNVQIAKNLVANHTYIICAGCPG